MMMMETRQRCELCDSPNSIKSVEWARVGRAVCESRLDCIDRVRKAGGKNVRRASIGPICVDADGREVVP